MRHFLTAALSTITLALLTSGANPAIAGPVVAFSFDIDTPTPTLVRAELTLGTDLGDGWYDITGLTGYILENPKEPIELAAPGTFLKNDNLFNIKGNQPGYFFVNANGLAFREIVPGGGGELYSLFLNGTSYEGCWDQGGCFQVVNLTASPEPSTLWLLGTGFAGVLAFARRRVKA